MEPADFFDRIERRLQVGAPSATVHLIRHAEPVPRHDRKDDELLDPPLVSQGRAHAQRLADTWPPKARPTRVCASSLRRAVETAEPLAQRFGIPVTTSAELREVELVDSAWLASGEHQHELSSFDASGRWDHLPGFESSQALRDRARSAVTSAVGMLNLSNADDLGAVALFSHGAFINAFVAEILGLEVDFFSPLSYTSVTTIMTDGERWVLTKLGGSPPEEGPA